MDLNVEFANNEGIIVVIVRGRIDASSSPTLSENIENHVFQDGGDVDALLIQMADVTYFSSAGARVLISLKKRMEAGGKKFALLNISTEVGEALELMNLHQIFPGYPDIESALKS